MSDIRTQDAPTLRHANDEGPNPTGDFIWYELMTPNPEGSKAFFDAVVGWNISGEGPPEYNGYRMIGRSDGKFAGGVLPLTPEMQQHGAHPTWLGYVHVADVDASIASIEQDRKSTRLNSSHVENSYAVFCLKKKKPWSYCRSTEHA